MVIYIVRWMSQEDICSFNVLRTDADGSQNYILEVDLQYPDKLHDHHTDYPMAGVLQLVQTTIIPIIIEIVCMCVCMRVCICLINAN